jgi:hypothetical protein
MEAAEYVYDHRGDHLGQRGVPTGMVSDLLAVAHPFETPAQDEAA